MSKKLASVAAFAALVALPGVALASGTADVWGDVEKITFEDATGKSVADETTATRIRLSGVFALTTGTAGMYDTPRRGELYFHCEGVNTATLGLCRTQWKDLLTYPTSSLCAGFGGNGSTKVTLTVGAACSVPKTPDKWNLGIGVQAGSCVPSGGAGCMCTTMKGMADPGCSGTDAGPADTGTDAGTKDTGTTTTDTGTASTDTGTAATDTGTAAADTGVPTATPPGGTDSGCSMGAPATLGANGVLLAAVGIAVARRRRARG